jgi:glycosyltransferase involved in cell wall biosynthesis
VTVHNSAELELTVVMPCLNEADTLKNCISAARAVLDETGIHGEILVADNGSTDGSQDVARTMGARVEKVSEKGYGAAIMGGIERARGRFILMGDSDESYDFREIPRFVEKLRDGYDLVQGCRLESGGGTVLPGAMPFLHRHLGNPVFSWLARWWFRTPIHDIHCGMRGFSADFYRTLELKCTGMEFASEMIIKATLLNGSIAEVPITLHPDGRVSHEPHLRTFRDGWRHLRFFLLFSPRWLFLAPGLLLILAGFLGFGLAMPGTRIAGVLFDVHTLLFSGLFLIVGYMAILFGIFTKMFATSEGLLPPDPRVIGLSRAISLERGLGLGILAFLGGGLLLLVAINQWRMVGFGDLDYRSTMRWVIPGATLAVLGAQTVLSSFFMGVLGLSRR